MHYIQQAKENEIRRSGRPRTSEELFIATLNRKEPMSYDKKLKKWFYSKEYNGGCTIGTWLTKSVDVESIEHISACDLPESCLPKRWVENKIPRGFLQDIQEIHDDKKCWENPTTGKLNNYGVVWSKVGIKKLADLIKEYKLDLKIKEELTISKKAIK